jgi:hypothetical protein
MELIKKSVYTGFTVLAVLAGVMIILHIITYRQIHKLHKEIEELSLVWGEEFRTLGERINLQGEELKKDIRVCGNGILIGDCNRVVGRSDSDDLCAGGGFWAGMRIEGWNTGGEG